MNRHYLKLVFIASLCAIIIAVSIKVFSIRFESGSLYPAYSTRRADPVGTKALYETIAQLYPENTSREENIVDFEQREHRRGDLLFLIGAAPLFQGPVPFDWKSLQPKLEAGATVVIATRPARAPAFASDHPIDEEGDDEEGPSGEEDSTPSELQSDDTDTSITLNTKLPLSSFVFLQDSGVSIGRLDKTSILKADTHLFAQPANPDFSQSLALKSIHYLELDQPEVWTVLYSIGEFPVVASRTVGNGTLIVSSDTYPFTNEGLLAERNSEFFAWLLKRKDTISFVELHLGVTRTKGLIFLARENGFENTLILALITAIAFIWNSSFSPCPKYAERPGDLAQQTEPNSGLQNLLSDAYKESEVAQAAYSQWLASLRHNAYSQKTMEAAHKRFESFLSTKKSKQDTISFYNDLANLLKR